MYIHIFLGFGIHRLPRLLSTSYRYCSSDIQGEKIDESVYHSIIKDTERRKGNDRYTKPVS